jgi:hypothetical protein
MNEPAYVIQVAIRESLSGGITETIRSASHQEPTHWMFELCRRSALLETLTIHITDDDELEELGDKIAFLARQRKAQKVREYERELELAKAAKLADPPA